MNLEYTHKPNYFLAAQLLIRYVQTKVQKTQSNEIEIAFQDLTKVFKGDFASSSTNLESILNIADEYKVETISGDQRIIKRYDIDSEEKHLHIFVYPQAGQALLDGKDLINPDASSYE